MEAYLKFTELLFTKLFCSPEDKEMRLIEIFREGSYSRFVFDVLCDEFKVFSCCFLCYSRRENNVSVSFDLVANRTFTIDVLKEITLKTAEFKT